MKQKITIKTIAKELGVSTSTVSKALRDSHEISIETKEKIKAYADFYNYKPNSLALQLRNQKTKVIGVILPKIVHHFFSTVIKGVERGASEKGYHVMACFSNESYESEVNNLNVLSNGSVDGLLISVAKETLENQKFGHFQDLINEEIPLVMFDRVLDSIYCDKVIVDDIGAGYKATKHLIENGRKRIAMLSTPEHMNIGALRKQGYVKALKEFELNFNPDLVLEVDDNADLREQISFLLSKDIDAIFAVNEIYAAMAIRVAKEEGKKVPEDISVVGFTDGLISEFSSPSITAIVQHGFTMGKQAVELLIDRIENDGDILPPRTKVISSDLNIRESS
ncbi:LacI family DNA-binding transcriptional regulator [Pseudotenacibaculum haliotis]|uniref:LacI family DNA-binding transcriptional regulator n=1 Tax=Pseudotenacibaculum haliotis TaxID=1862138 RepID=A0ABW5LTY9_9FLAO